MKITVFTSNQPRHLNLINSLSSISEKTYAVMECNTVFPGVVQDFYRKSEVMQKYFRNVMASEKKIFGDISFLDSNVNPLAIKSGDLNLLNETQLAAALDSDVYVVFGASYIKGWLIDFLVKNKAINIHMGVSPYYRGSSCNFWALFDGNPQYVGATIHLLSKGLDSGPMLYHAQPKFEGDDPFDFTMRSVEVAQRSLTDRIASGELRSYAAEAQDKSQEIRYTRNADFTDEAAKTFLDRNLTAKDIESVLGTAPRPKLLRAYIA